MAGPASAVARPLGWGGLAGIVLATAACGPTQEEIQAYRAQAASERVTTCNQTGIAEGTDAYQLCLLMAEANQRLDRLERRVDLLELNGGFAYPYAYGPYGPWR